jgi:hypothetical protein
MPISIKSVFRTCVVGPAPRNCALFFEVPAAASPPAFPSPGTRTAFSTIRTISDRVPMVPNASAIDPARAEATAPTRKGICRSAAPAERCYFICRASCTRKASVAITINLSFSEWVGVFGDGNMTTAMLDPSPIIAISSRPATTASALRPARPLQRAEKRK